MSIILKSALEQEIGGEFFVLATSKVRLDGRLAGEAKCSELYCRPVVRSGLLETRNYVLGQLHPSPPV